MRSWNLWRWANDLLACDSLGLGTHTHGGMLDFSIQWLDVHDIKTLNMKPSCLVDVHIVDHLNPQLMDFKCMI